MQAERIGAADRAAGANELVQARAAGLERARELLLLGLDRVEHGIPPLGELRICLAHDVDHDRSGLAQERPRDPEQPAVAHRAPNDAAQHVAGTLVRRGHALGQQEGHGARVIGDHLVAEALALDGLGVVTDELRQALDDRHEQIGPVVRVDALDCGRQALEPGAGVNALEREGREGPVRRPIELHEDEVADLQPARAVLRMVRDALRPLGELDTAVVVQLAAGPAGAGLAHAPEVLLVADRDVAPAHEPLRRQPDLIGPDGGGLVVIGVDRCGKKVRRNAELVRQQLPVPVDRLALEVVAEAPVAEHLEQGVVARRAADLLEVVVLAGHPKNGLRVDGAHVVALLLAGQHALERRHPGVHEEQRRDRPGRAAAPGARACALAPRRSAGSARGSRPRSSAASVHPSFHDESRRPTGSRVRELRSSWSGRVRRRRPRAVRRRPRRSR